MPSNDTLLAQKAATAAEVAAATAKIYSQSQEEYADDAAASATEASGYATSASNYASLAEQYYSMSLSGVLWFVGTFATAPTSRSDGSALETGDMYKNTTDNEVYSYNTDGTWSSMNSDATLIQNLYSAGEDLFTQGSEMYDASTDIYDATYSTIENSDQFAGAYEDGPLTITSANRWIIYSGDRWYVSPSASLPFKTSGVDSSSWVIDSYNFFNESEKVLDDFLNDGDSKIELTQGGTLAVYLQKTVILNDEIGLTSDGLLSAVEMLRNSDGVVSGCIEVPYGRMLTLDKTVTIDTGQNSSSVDKTESEYTARFSLICKGSILHTAGIGDGIIINNAFRPYLDIYLTGGGADADTDRAIRFKNTLGGVVKIKAYNFLGTCLFYSTTYDGNWQEVEDISIYNRFGGRSIYLRGPITGFGHISQIASVWPASSDLIIDIGDIDYGTYGSTTPSKQTTSTLQITNGSSHHFENLLVGEGGQSSGMVVFTNVTEVSVLNGFVWGGNNDDQIDTGIIAYGTQLHIQNMRAGNMQYPIVAQSGSKLTIGSYSGNQNVTDIVLDNTSAATTPIDVDITTFNSSNCNAQAITVKSNVTQGSLIINGGTIRTPNKGGAADYCLNLYGGTGFSAKLSNIIQDSGSYSKGSLTFNNGNNLSVSKCTFPEKSFVGGYTGVSKGAGLMRVNDSTSFLPVSPSLNSSYVNNTGGNCWLTIPFQVSSGVTATANLVVTDSIGNAVSVDSTTVTGPASMRLQGFCGNGDSVSITNSGDVTLNSGARVYKI